MILLGRFSNDDARLRQRENLQNAVATSYPGRQLAHRMLKLLVTQANCNYLL